MPRVRPPEGWRDLLRAVQQEIRASGLSLRRVAREVGISHSYLVRLLGGESRSGRPFLPSLQTVERLRSWLQAQRREFGTQPPRFLFFMGPSPPSLQNVDRLAKALPDRKESAAQLQVWLRQLAQNLDEASRILMRLSAGFEPSFESRTEDFFLRTDGGQSLRPYQQKALRLALDHEGIVLVLPTGTGKAVLACAWACQILNRRLARRILVLEPSRFLVEQTWTYFREKTNIPTEKVHRAQQRQERISRWRGPSRVTVATPQAALNDVDELQDYEAVIVDECHHTAGEHAYKQLMETCSFKRRLGLSTDIPAKLRTELEELIGKVFQWTHTDPDVEPYVPDWYGEVLDAELIEEEREVLRRLEEKGRDLEGTPFRGLVSLAVRMMCRDGPLALKDALQRDTLMDRLLGEELLPLLEACRPLHKLAELRKALERHEFQKAVVFVDHGVVAHAIARAFPELKPVLLLGRDHRGQETRKGMLEQAKREYVRLIVCTTTGEEKIDLPGVDLVILWSNSADHLSCILGNRKGMRRSLQTPEKVRAGVFIATPDTPDYEALHRAVLEARGQGVDVLFTGERGWPKGTVLGRVKRAIEEAADRQRLPTIKMLAQDLGIPLDRLRAHLRQLVNQGEVLYVYSLRSDEMMERCWERRMAWYDEPSGQGERIRGGGGQQDHPHSGERLRWMLRLGRLREEERVYFPRQKKYPIESQVLFSAPTDIRIKVRVKGEKDNQSMVAGSWPELVRHLTPQICSRRVSLTCFWSGRYASLMADYQGVYGEREVEMVLRNACWLAHQLRLVEEAVARQISGEEIGGASP